MNKHIENLILGIAAASVFAGLPTLSFAQSIWRSPPSPKPAVTVAPYRPAPRTMAPSEPSRSHSLYARETSEKFIKVDSSVKVTLDCVTEGTIKVNGWNRNEVRMFVNNGALFGFRVAQKSAKTGDPVWIKVVRADTKGKYGPTSECISGSEIEIDVPMNATVAIKGNEITTTVDSIKRAEIRTIGGDISLRNIPSGISANASQGDITVEKSEGAMTLSTSTGNILVFEAGPSEIGDVFKANTHSGAVTLQQLEYRQIDVRSISGSVAFNGEILSGGSYSMNTTKGSIRLSIPLNSSCVVNASYGFGTFNTEIPLKILTENISSGPLKSIVGTFGKGGDATLKLTSINGSIGIKKQ